MPNDLYVITHPGRGVFIGYRQALVGENGSIPHFRHRAPAQGKLYKALEIAKDDLEILKRRHGLRRCHITLVKTGSHDSTNPKA